MKNWITLLLISLLFFSCGGTDTPGKSAGAQTGDDNADNAPKGKLYLRTQMWVNSFGSSLDISWIYLGDDGSIIKNPKYGVDPVNIGAERQDNAENTGKYVIAGDRMKVTWQDGKTAQWRVEFDGDNLKGLDGGITTQQNPLPEDFRLNGKYATGAVVPNAAASSTLTFSPDGRFIQSDFIGVSTPEDTASSSSGSQGSYTINGNTLTLNYDSGEKLIAVVTLWKYADGKTHLVINQNSYPQES